VEEGETRGIFVKAEEIELLAEHPMIALLRLFEEGEVLLQVVLAEESGAIDAHQLLPLRICTPVGTRHCRELGVLEKARVRHVGPAAEIHEIAVAIEGERVAPPLDLAHQLELELVVATVDGLVAREDLVLFRVLHLAALEGVRLLGNAPHLLLDGGEVLWGDLPVREVDVVVEPVLHHRPDGELGARIEAEDRVRHEVGGRVPQHLERLGILLREQRHLGAVREWGSEVDDLVADPGGDGRLGEAGADLGGEVRRGGASTEFARTPVRESHLGHPSSPCGTDTPVLAIRRDGHSHRDRSTVPIGPCGAECNARPSENLPGHNKTE
jgi:hypothetical protein